MREQVSIGGSPSNPAAVAFLRQSSRKKRLILGLTALTLLLTLIAINAGAADTHPVQVLRALLGLESGTSRVVIWNIRLPRVIAGIVTGIKLAVAGCVMQTCLRKPLASPFTLGISNAAAFGANLAIVFLGAGTLHSNTSMRCSSPTPIPSPSAPLSFR
jgi:iron complex transport system permease protein